MLGLLVVVGLIRLLCLFRVCFGLVVCLCLGFGVFVIGLLAFFIFYLFITGCFDGLVLGLW